MEKDIIKDIKGFVLKVSCSLLVISVAAAGTGVIKSYTNEVEIKNLYSILVEIKDELKSLNTKVDNLKEKVK